MIPLAFNAECDAAEAFVTRLVRIPSLEHDSVLLGEDQERSLWSGSQGVFSIANSQEPIVGDVVLLDPHSRRAERLLRAGSAHNTLLVTERCDQLCVMCSQPPKKQHIDRFDEFEAACLLAPEGQTIGISGGEPTLFLDRLIPFLHNVLSGRPDLSFHVLSNGQHIDRSHVEDLSSTLMQRVTWGIPLYGADAQLHDGIVDKEGAFDRLLKSFSWLMLAGARIELRTVLMRDTLAGLQELARLVVHHLPHIEQWSLMGLENIGFARNRWDQLQPDIRQDFEPLASAINLAVLYGLRPRLFNLPLCHLPEPYRDYAVPSISDWKQRFGKSCAPCTRRAECSGFFQWHPEKLIEGGEPL